MTFSKFVPTMRPVSDPEAKTEPILLPAARARRRSPQRTAERAGVGGCRLDRHYEFATAEGALAFVMLIAVCPWSGRWPELRYRCRDVRVRVWADGAADDLIDRLETDAERWGGRRVGTTRSLCRERRGGDRANEELQD